MNEARDDYNEKTKSINDVLNSQLTQIKLDYEQNLRDLEVEFKAKKALFREERDKRKETVLKQSEIELAPFRNEHNRKTDAIFEARHQSEEQLDVDYPNIGSSRHGLSFDKNWDEFRRKLDPLEKERDQKIAEIESDYQKALNEVLI